MWAIFGAHTFGFRPPPLSSNRCFRLFLCESVASPALTLPFVFPRYGKGVKAKLFALQHPADCSSARYVVAEKHGGSGFGSRFWFYRMCLSKAFILGRVFLQMWTGPMDFQHLEPWTNCTPATKQAAVALHGPEAVVGCTWPGDVLLWMNAMPPEVCVRVQ